MISINTSDTGKSKLLIIILHYILYKASSLNLKII